MITNFKEFRKNNNNFYTYDVNYYFPNTLIIKKNEKNEDNEIHSHEYFKMKHSNYSLLEIEERIKKLMELINEIETDKLLYKTVSFEQLFQLLNSDVLEKRNLVFNYKYELKMLKEELVNRIKIENEKSLEKEQIESDKVISRYSKFTEFMSRFFK